MGGVLLFERELRSEGKLGFWRWASIFVGVVGTYRKNDSVDLAYTVNGRNVVATKLPLEPARVTSADAGARRAAKARRRAPTVPP